MPRLSHRKYLEAHHRLKGYWLHENMAFGFLRPQDQWYLHDFFQPSKGLTDQQLREHRARVTQERPTLPHRAGRALATIDEIAPRVALFHARTGARAAAQHTGRRTNHWHATSGIQLFPVVKPEISDEGLARLVAAMVMHQERLREQSEDDVTAA